MTEIKTETYTDLEVQALAQAQAEEDRLLMAAPIENRPLRLIPGRNRAEKRTYRKLASMADRGTVGKGQLAKLKALWLMLKQSGGVKEGSK